LRPRGLVSGEMDAAELARVPRWWRTSATNIQNGARPSKRVTASHRAGPHAEPGDILPDELRAAGLMVPVPSVTPRPLVVCAEYMASGGARRERRQRFRDARSCAFRPRTRFARQKRRIDGR
jgi:hypothetical protein